jgi:hypothetical protein
MPSITQTGKLWLDNEEIQAIEAQLHVQQEWIDVRTMTPPMKPDLGWEYIDQAGHYHAFSDGGKQLPTLDQMSRHVGCDGCDEHECEGWDEQYWRCQQCLEEITPGMKPDYTDPQKIPGRKTWQVRLELRDAALAENRIYSLRLHLGEQIIFGFVAAHLMTYESEGIAHLRSYDLQGLGPMGERHG